METSKTKAISWWATLRTATKIILAGKNKKISYDGLSPDEIEKIYNNTNHF